MGGRPDSLAKEEKRVRLAQKEGAGREIEAETKTKSVVLKATGGKEKARLVA